MVRQTTASLFMWYLMFPGGLASQGSGAVTPLAQIPSLAWKLPFATGQAQKGKNNKINK